VVFIFFSSLFQPDILGRVKGAHADHRVGESIVFPRFPCLNIGADHILCFDPLDVPLLFVNDVNYLVSVHFSFLLSPRACELICEHIKRRALLFLTRLFEGVGWVILL